MTEVEWNGKLFAEEACHSTGKEQVEVGVDWNWNWNVGANGRRGKQMRLERGRERGREESRALSYRARCPERGFYLPLPPSSLSVPSL